MLRLGFALVIALTPILSAGCVVSAEADSSAAAVESESTSALSVEEEETLLRKLMQQSIDDYETKWGSRLGAGWFGNVTGSGDKCDVVHDRFDVILNKLVRANINERKTKFRHHDIGTIVASGWLCEGLSGHVYMALYRVDEKGKVKNSVAYFDPWRSEKAFFAADPNTGAGEPILWGIPTYRPSTDSK